MSTQTKTMEPLLDPSTTLRTGLNLRPARWTDLNAVAQLIYDVCEADGDTAVAVTPEELKHEWQTSGFNLETDAFLVETTDGRIVGFEEFNNQHGHVSLTADGCVLPEFKGMGIGTSLLRVIEERARLEIALAQPGLRVFLRSMLDRKDKEGNNLHKNEGYLPMRYHWRMEIVLKGPPAEPQWPEGIELRP